LFVLALKEQKLSHSQSNHANQIEMISITSSNILRFADEHQP